MTDTLDDDGGELLSIGMFAREVRLAISAVRFYDDCGLLPPAFVDPSSGYRYYRHDQVQRGRVIRDLRAAEMSIAQIRAVLDAPPAAASTMLAEHRSSLERRLIEAKQRLATVRAALTRTESHMPTTCVVSAAELAAAVRQVAPAAAALGTAPNQETRVIEGVLVTLDSGTLRLVATDRYRLAIREIVPAVVEGADARVVVEVADLQTATEQLRTGDVTITIDDSALSITSSGGATDMGVVAGGPFPQYERLLPDSSTLVHRALLPAAALRGALEPLADRAAVVLHFDEDVAVSVVRGPAEAVDGSEASGPPAAIAVNTQFLLEATRLAVGPDVVLEASAPLKPLVVRSATDGSFTCLVMPVRIDFPTSPDNLALEADDHGRPRGWQAPPPASLMPNASATTGIDDGALTLTVARADVERVAAWQVIDAGEVRGKTIAFTAAVTATLGAGGAARLVLEPLDGDTPAAPPGDARVYSDDAAATGAPQRLEVGTTVPDTAQWVRLALAVEGTGTATFRDLEFAVT